MHSEKYLFIEIDRSIISNVTPVASQSDLFEEGIVTEIIEIAFSIYDQKIPLNICESKLYYRNLNEGTGAILLKITARI